LWVKSNGVYFGSRGDLKAGMTVLAKTSSNLIDKSKKEEEYKEQKY
jgi:hypothetical protein